VVTEATSGFMGIELTAELEAHCRDILGDRRIKGRVVILCEGGTDQRGRLSPQSYRQNDRLPDANFYQACVPAWWRQQGTPLPKFINSGDRSKVISTYFGLRQLHRHAPEFSYLNPHHLFALIDLDLQSKRLEHYAYPDSERIFHALYRDGLFRSQDLELNHHILVTGLVHKEAYYLLPEVASIYQENQVCLNGNLLELDDLYFMMADTANGDPDLKIHFNQVRQRLSCGQYFECQNLPAFQESWQDSFEDSLMDNAPEKRLLIHNLLTVCKAKRYWKQLHPSPGDSRSSAELQDQLIPFIGRIYANQAILDEHQIPSLFQAIYRIAYRPKNSAI
jgi:hypothetical protein